MGNFTDDLTNIIFNGQLPFVLNLNSLTPETTRTAFQIWVTTLLTEVFRLK